MHEPWRVCLFGGIRACRQGHTLTRFRTRKTAALLAYLACHQGRSYPREELAEALWPESEPDLSRRSLKTALSSLRHQLEPPGVPAGAVIAADRFTVGLNPKGFTSDVGEFAEALEAASAATTGSERVRQLSRAVGIYQHPMLPGFYEDWIIAERDRLAEEYLAAAEELADLLQEHGEPARAAAVCRRAVAADPSCEAIHRRLMRSLDASGEPLAALRHYQELARILERELGVTPDAATRALVREIEARATDAGASAPKRQSAAASPPSSPAPVPSPTRGTFTFLLADIEKTEGFDMTTEEGLRALSECGALVQQVCGQHGGVVIRRDGDAHQVAFAGAASALACALALQQATALQARPVEAGALCVRLALHSGEVEPGSEGWSGPALEHAARLLEAAHGGQVLCSESTAALARSDRDAGVHLRDLGLFRLDPEGPPARLFQVDPCTRAVAEFPPPRAEPAHRGSLPLQLTRFFGREEEIARLGQILAPAPSAAASSRRTPTRLVTLTGPGGCGKTRLAVEAAARMESAYRGAVWFIALQDVSDPQHIPDAILEGLGISHSATAEPLEQVAQLLSCQPSLLVVDNLEQVVEEGAAIVQRLLQRVADLTVFATSRRALDIPGERRFPVSPLPTPPHLATPESLCRCESVQLFVDRAQAVKPDFQVTGGNAPAISELCERLEGIPLAIELAAARIQMLTPAQMLSELAHRFDLLVSRRRVAAERQRTLRATIDWSYRLLSPDLQRLFAYLSVFRGGWTAAAAEAVCRIESQEGAASAPGVTLDRLAQLVECSLVLAETDDRGGDTRFRMLETLREYAWERTSAKERALLEWRHAEYYFSWARDAAAHLDRRGQELWYARLEAEYGNLRAGLQWCRKWAPAEVRLQWGTALARFWAGRGYATEGREWLAAALQSAGALPPSRLRAEALMQAGILARAQTNYSSALTFLDEALALCRSLGEREGEAHTLGHLSDLAFAQGDYERARSLAGEALTLARAIGSLAAEALALHSLGNVASDTGEYASAHDCYERTLAIQRELGAVAAEARVLHSLAVTWLEQGNLEAARLHFEQALEINRRIGNRRAEAGNIHLLACVTKPADREKARELWHQALAIHREVNNRAWECVALGDLGHLAIEDGDDEGAARLGSQAHAIACSIGDRAVEALTLFGMGKSAAAAGHYERAAEHLSQAVALQREIGTRPDMLSSLEACAQLLCATGQMEQAARLFGAVEGLSKALGSGSRHPLPRDEDDTMVAMRAALGACALDAAWDAGRAMDWDQVASFVRDVLSPRCAPQCGPSSTPAGTAPRPSSTPARA